MKPSINKLFFAALLSCSLAACTDDKPQPAPEKQPQAAAPVQTQQPAEPEKPVSSKPTVKPKPQPKKDVTYTAEQLSARLKEWDKKLNTLSTQFEQSTSYDGVQVSRSRGTLSYDKAHNFLRLDTLSRTGETEQSAVTNKKEIIILDETGAHVTTLSWADWQQGQPNQALFDFGNYTALVDKHNAAVTKQTPQEAVLVLTPKEGEEYELYLTLSKTDFFPREIAIKSDLMLTKATLSAARKNAPLPEQTFGGFFE
uniref:Outer-membrane lipoprotein carrier protein n=1 Tax=uncultured Elusimicrobia bacterium TaxID=699876 RepID=A0A650ELV6_9BACT|nr:hypothetical protein Elusimicrob1349_0560 [uncultured Elusimicrobia bacterium]